MTRVQVKLIIKSFVKAIISMIRTIQFILTDILYPTRVKLFWFNGKYNFGDAINPILLKKLTGQEISWVDPKLYKKENYLAIGSVLESASESSIIWGSGFISQSGHCYKKPKRVCAVRGPLSREKLLQDNIDCPQIYGDPALILPMVYSPKIEKKFELGIVPHFVDRNDPWLKKMSKHPEIKILNIQDPDPYRFIDTLLSCNKIASSSLHGIIVADAYQIPSIWIEFSDKVLGDGFKFLDYFASVHRKDTTALKINEHSDLKSIYAKFYDYKIDIDIDALINAFPLELDKDAFLSKSVNHAE